VSGQAHPKILRRKTTSSGAKPMTDDSVSLALSLALAQAVDEIARLKETQREAIETIKHLSLEVSAMYAENNDLLETLKWHSETSLRLLSVKSQPKHLIGPGEYESFSPQQSSDQPLAEHEVAQTGLGSQDPRP